MWPFHISHFRTKRSLDPQSFLLFFFWHYHVKSEGRSVPEHPDIIKASKNLRNYYWNFDNEVSLPSKITNFTPFPHTKPFFAIKIKKKHHTKWHTMVETILLSLILRCQYILIWGLAFFNAAATICCPYLARPLKAYTKKTP